MEFVPGKALDRLIPRKGLRLNEALKYAIQVADALAAAHAGGHRASRPETGQRHGERGRLRESADFGLAKLIEHVGQASRLSILPAPKRPPRRPKPIRA